MRKTTTNEFKDGLNLDLHPIVTPNTVLTDNLNGTFITYNGNELCLQNDRGNTYTCDLSPGFIPIGAKEHGGIIYIVSVNNTETEIGTFPGIANWDIKKGDLDYNYYPLGNLYIDEKKEIPKIIDDKRVFRSNLGYDVTTPVTIEIQDSYDGSVNLIILGGENKPMIINSGFSIQPERKYEIIDRSQNSDTNKYSEIKLLEQVGLIRTSDVITNIDLHGYINGNPINGGSDDDSIDTYILGGGQLKGGNYKFYIKFGDADYNQTDVVAESPGMISIFNGKNRDATSISGTLLDERTDKMIGLDIDGLNHTYSKIYVYYSREYSDTNGYRMTEYMMLNNPIDMIEDINVSKQTIWITGYEQEVPINPEELNVDYHTVDFAKAETQQSNMLFLANIGKNEETFETYEKLKEFSQNITVTANFGALESDDGDSDLYSWRLYYDVSNIYYKLGYYPGEIYRFGVVYVFDDNSTSPVFNIKGGEFVLSGSQFVLDSTYPSIFGVEPSFCKKGVVIIPEESEQFQVLKHYDDGIDVVSPIYLTFTVPNSTELIKRNVKSWFIVRQKRIPNEICEGLSIKIDTKSHTPIIYDGINWISQSFLSVDRTKLDSSGKVSASVTLSYDNSSFGSKSGSKTLSFEEWASQYGYQSTSSQQGTVYVQQKDCETVKCDNWREAKRKLNRSQNGDHFWELYAYKTGSKDSLIATVSTYIGPVTLYHSTFNLYIDGIKTSVTKNGWFRTRTNEVVIHYWSDEPQIPSEIVIDPDCKNYDVKLHDRIKRASGKLRVYSGQQEYPSEYLDYLNKYGGSISDKKLIADTSDTNKAFSSDGLLSLDPCTDSTIRSILNGTKHIIKKRYDVAIDQDPTCGYYQYSPISKDWEENNSISNRKLVFVNSDTAVKVVDRYAFSNLAGDPADASKFSYFTNILYHNANPKVKPDKKENLKPDYTTRDYTINEYKHSNNINIIRGKFCPFIGITENQFSVNEAGIYSVKLKDKFAKQDLDVRGEDNGEYYCISKRFPLSADEVFEEVVYGGDCFICTSTIRIIRNFIDTVAPVSENILDPDGWQENVVERGYTNEIANSEVDRFSVDFGEINLSDVNTVDLGMWATFRTLSSINLGIRSQDFSHTDEMALLGSPRTFYPLNGASTATGAKMEESWLLNDGYNAVVGRKQYNLLQDIPYTKSEFSNRIMFSNVNVSDAFTNGYRTFQGLSYKDYDKQYGEITKLVSLGSNILCIMEHGIGLITVNERALMQTTTGEAIHIYGHGVLPDNMTIISQDYGSKYPNSVIRTPIGVYGIDTDARKIWRVSDKNGFETISDMKIETYLNDNLFTDVNSSIETVDVRTHYNAFKGDVMFTFYNTEKSYLIVPHQIILTEDEEVLYDIKTNITDIAYEVLDPNIVEIIMKNNKLYIKGKSAGNTSINISKEALRKATLATVRPKSPTPAISKKYLTRVPKDVTLYVGDIRKYSFVEELNVARLSVTYDESIIGFAMSSKEFSIMGTNQGTTSVVLKYGNEIATCNVHVLANYVEPEPVINPYPVDPSTPSHPVNPSNPTDPDQPVVTNEYLTVYLQKPRIGEENGEMYPDTCVVYVTCDGKTDYYTFDEEVVFTFNVKKNSILRVRCSVEGYEDYDVRWTITKDKTFICPTFGEYVYLTIGSISPSCAVVTVYGKEVSEGDSLRFIRYGYAEVQASCEGYLPYYEFMQLPESRTIDIDLSDGDCYLSLIVHSYMYSDSGGYQTTSAPTDINVDYTITTKNGDTYSGSCDYNSGLDIPVHVGDSVSYTITAENYNTINGYEENITGPTVARYFMDRSDYYEFRAHNIPDGESFVVVNGAICHDVNVLNFQEGDVLYIEMNGHEGRNFVMPGYDVVLDVTEFFS